jgi:hypothetical protein
VPPFTVRHEAALLEVEDLVGSGVQRQLRLDGPVVPIEVGVFDGNNGVSCWVTGVYAVVAANPPE